MRALIGLLILLSACAAPTPTPVIQEYLALGDSYTIGEGVHGGQAYPAQLAEGLRAQGAALEFEVIARSGWTTGELMAAVEERGPGGRYDLVTLLAGANDQFRGHTLEEYRADFRALLRKAIRLAGDRPEGVVVISIPDWGASPVGESYGWPGVAQEIDAYNAVNREEAEAAGARYVDITPRSRDFAGQPQAYVADGLHPSGMHYSAWVELILPQALAALRGE